MKEKKKKVNEKISNHLLMFCIKYIWDSLISYIVKSKVLLVFSMNGHNSAKSKYLTSKIEIL